MAYLSKFKYDIFISYAHEDNRSRGKGYDRWVDQFYESLAKNLSSKFETDNSLSIWRDEQLSRIAILRPSIIDACKNSTILVCITSPNYIKSDWCKSEYEAFCLKNKNQRPPRHGNLSRIINVKHSPISSKPHKTMYDEMFGHSNGYEFYDSDPKQKGATRLWDTIDHRYQKLIDQLAHDIAGLLKSMGVKSRGNAPKQNPIKLSGILRQAEEHIIISANTFNKFSDDDSDDVREALISLLSNGKKVTLIMLNPRSTSAQANAPYYRLESSGPSEAHYVKTLKFLSDLFGLLKDSSKARFEVLLSNYIPRFRTIIVDEKRVYLYFYMYDNDVNAYPDLVLGKKDPLFGRVITSTYNLRDAPEIIPYIRDKRVYEYWEHSKLAQWDRWTSEVRYRHKITHQYYVGHAQEFHEMFGHPPEDYVQKHLDLLKGRTMVLGCGSGKEVEHLSKHGQCSEIYGVDFSPEAIKLARANYPNSPAKFIMADFYDLEYIVDGEFDSIAANATFVHLFEQEDMPEMLSRIWKKLRPGGLCFIRNLYKEKDGESEAPHYHESPKRFNDPRWFVYYSRAHLVKLATNAGFLIEHNATETIATECKPEEKLKVVMKKGFQHENKDFVGVYWPTILLVKPDQVS